MAINLTGQKIKDTYQEILHVDGGVDGTDKPIYDGDGTELPIKVSTTSIDITSLKLATVPIVATGAEVNLLAGVVALLEKTDIGTAPNEIPLNQYLGNLAFQDSNGVVLNPVALAVPSGIGDMVFQLTNDTTLVIKVKGSDGTVRSVALTLA